MKLYYLKSNFMSFIVQKNKEIKNRKKVGIMTHVVIGYPSLEETEALVIAMSENGVDYIELQIPFSDPVADGSTILKASQISLDNKTRVKDAFLLVNNLRKKNIKIPLIFMTYANIVYSYGIDKFVEDSKTIGVDGFIIPDLPFDTKEGERFYETSKINNLEHIPLYAPNITDSRYNFLSKYSNNLVYAVSRTGITGTKGVSLDIDDYILKIRKNTNAKIALGFGIQSHDQINKLSEKVDILVLGSHLLNLFNKQGISSVVEFLKKI
jgi:tryptophan synthase alpha chain